MSDNVTLPGVGDVVAADDAGAGGKVQIIKLAISADGSATVIPADAANGLDVDVTRLPALPAGTFHIGQVGSDGLWQSNALTMSVAGVYSTGDYIGPSTTSASLAGATRVSGGRAILQSLLITDKLANDPVPMELWLFGQAVTVPTDNAAWDISDVNVQACVGVIPITTDRWFKSASNKVYCDPNIGLQFVCAATTLGYALVARGTTPSYASQDIAIAFGILQD